MADQDKKIQMLNVAHDINRRVDDAIKKCQTLIDNPEVPSAVKIWFIDIQTALQMQQMLCKLSLESSLQLEDLFDDMIKKSEARLNQEQ